MTIDSRTRLETKLECLRLANMKASEEDHVLWLAKQYYEWVTLYGAVKKGKA